MNPAAYTEMAQAQRTHWWYTARRRILAGQLRELALPPDARILEVGSGTGANLELLARFGDVVGLEMSARAIDLARQEVASPRVRMVQGRCPDDLQGLPGNFDLICLFDVLEHIDNDSACLKRVARLLRPGGRILLTVPAYRWLWGPHDEQMHHRRRYTRSSLALACTSAGFRVARLSHFNTFLFPLAVAGRIMERLSGSNRAATRVPPKLVNTAMAAVFGSESGLLKMMSLPFGLSLLALAEPMRQPAP